MKTIFNSLEFGGINSIEQDIFITGESAYNAPERDVEQIEIPGRSGDYLLDKGRWKNIDVTYTCGCFGENQSEFAKKMRNFRNLLASRYGYHRLVDTYNPEEYRLGVFKNPVEVDTRSMKRAGEFEITFNCKPQRYLMSGETERVVTNGEKLFNPTPFDSNPLLAVKGYGTIEFNGYTIEIDDGMVGDIVALDEFTKRFYEPSVYYNDITTEYLSYSWSIDYSEYADAINQGDSISIASIIANCMNVPASGDINYVDGNTFPLSWYGFSCEGSELSFTAFPDTAETWSDTVSKELGIQLMENHFRVILSMSVTNNPNGMIDVSVSYFCSTDVSGNMKKTLTSFQVSNIVINSSVSRIGNPTYIDCDLGDAYMIKNGTYIGLNKYIDLGSDLPTLASGNNEITFDNTVTELKITPRWWIL